MPASIDHMTTNFDRIERGVLDHKRTNPDEAGAKTLKGLLVTATKEAKAEIVATAKEAGDKLTLAEVTPEQFAQLAWDKVIAAAIAAGVQTSVPGTRGNEFRAEARKAAKAAAAPAEVDAE